MSEPTTALSRVQTISELAIATLPRLELGASIGKKMLEELQASQITNDIEKETFINKMVKVKQAYEKMKTLRMQVTAPLDALKDDLMSFERDMDNTKVDNAFAQAKMILTAYDQEKLAANKKKEAEAELLRQTTVYKGELNAAVGRACIEMLAGQERNLIDGLSKWEANMTLENFAAKEAEINREHSPQLKMDKYDACFNVNFAKKHLMNEEDTKSFIEGLKLIYPYDIYNKKYVQVAAELKNSYRARMPSIKVQLVEAKTNKEAEEKRQADIKAKEAENLKASAEAANKEVQEVVNQQDLSTIEADFTKQGQLADVSSGPTKKEASFTNDDLWIRPFLAVVQEVAKTMTNIKNTKGQYITPIQWFLTRYESIGKPLDGLTLKDVPKTILKASKTEE